MNNHLMIVLYSILCMHLGVIVIELVVSTYNFFRRSIKNTFLRNYAGKDKNKFFGVYSKQLMAAILRLSQIFIFFSILYISSKLGILIDDNKRTDQSVSISSPEKTITNLPEEDMTKEGGNLKENSYKGKDKENKNEKLAAQTQPKTCLTAKISIFFRNERNVLLLLSYFYFIGLCVFFFNYLFSFYAIVFLLAPFIYYKVNLKLYEIFETKKCFIFNPIQFLMLLFVQIVYISLNCDAKRMESSFLPKQIQEWFLRENKNLIVQKIESEFVNVSVTELGFLTFVRIYGDWDLLTEDEKISILYHEIGHIENNSLFYRLLILAFNIIVLTFLENYLLRFSSCFVSNKLTKKGSYFVTSMIINITIAPLFNILTNIFCHYDEMNADEFSIKNYDKKHLANGLSKITVNFGFTINNSYVYELFYFSHPSLERRLENIGVGVD